MNLWNVEGVPHKGWECIRVDDLGELAGPGEEIEYAQCEMCGNERIRYVHVMTHPDYLPTLSVGCVCAEKMTDDYITPRRIEAAKRNKAARKLNFDKSPWNYNPLKCSYTKKYKGIRITIVKSRYGNWGIYMMEYVIWKYKDEAIKEFKLAERLAFELFEAYKKWVHEDWAA